MRCFLSAFFLLLSSSISAADTNSFAFTTLNCYWYFQSGNNTEAAARLSFDEWDRKAGHLIGLLSTNAPLFVGFQEIGDARDLTRLAHAATQRYTRDYQVLFAQGRDSATDQDVGAILDTSRGWGVYGRASRHGDLERELSKHMVVRLTNAVTHIDVCVVHLRVPRGPGGQTKQREQNQALLRWSMRHLANDPKANLWHHSSQ